MIGLQVLAGAVVTPLHPEIARGAKTITRTLWFRSRGRGRGGCGSGCGAAACGATRAS